MKKQGAKQELLIFTYLLLPGILADITKGGERCNFNISFHGPFPITERKVFSFQSSRAVTLECLKLKFLNNIQETLHSLGQNAATESTIQAAKKSCSSLINDDSFRFNYVPRNNTKFLWYPLLDCKHTPKTLCKGVKDHFQNCNQSLANLEKSIPEGVYSPNDQNFTTTDLRVDLLPSIPWECQAEYTTAEKSKILMSLNAVNHTLTKDCSKLLCLEYKILSKVTILSYNGSTELTCRNKLQQHSNLPSCYTEDNAFCFYTLKDSQSQRTIVIISKNKNISENEKIVYIFQHLANFQGNNWCEYPLKYKKQSKIIHDIHHTYYFCHGSPDVNHVNDSWIIKDITYTESLVAVNGNVNATIIESNVMLQSLIFAKQNINITVYNALSGSNIFKHYTDELRIPVFEAKYSQVDLLEYIKPEKCIVSKNKHFSKLTDTRSIWSTLNWIIFHNCSLHYKNGDKDLFLFLYNGSIDMEYICNNNTAVILTSIRKQNVNFLNPPEFARGCYDGGLQKKNSKECENIIQHASDYETRFFHFLIYPQKLNKDLALQQLKLASKVETFTVKFEANTHPELLGGFTILHQNDTHTLGTDYNELQLQSLQKTLQIFIMANFTNNTKCLLDIEESRFSIDLNIKEDQSHYVIGPISSNIFNTSCLRYLPFEIYKDLHNSNDKGLLRVNKFWPSCKYNMLIAWNENTYNSTVIPDWDYLSKSCKTSELTLFILCFSLTLTTVTGNTIGILIMILSRLIKKNVYMVYASLTVAGLLTGITSASLALFDTYRLMSGQLTFHNLTGVNSISSAFEQRKDFPHMVFPRYGWSAMSSIAMNTALMSSIMSLALLGIISFLMLQQKYSCDGQENNRKITKFLNFIEHHLKYAILIIWVWNIISATMINSKQGSFTGYLDPITKLTLNYRSNETSLSSIMYIIQSCLAIIAMVIVTSAFIFIIYKSKIKEQVTLTDQEGDTVQVITQSFTRMAILFLVSCGPVAINILTNGLLSNVYFLHPVFHFFIWWLCVAGSSGHWIILVFSKQCSREMIKFLERFSLYKIMSLEEIPLS